MAETAAARSMFAAGFRERRDLEQYFWTRATVDRLLHALLYSEDCCCLAVPSLAHAMHRRGKDEVLLDLDERFNYLPRFQLWDLRQPTPVNAGRSAPFSVIVFDPPFFYIPMEELYRAVLYVCNGDTKTRILIGFLKREEKLLLKTFHAFKLRRTRFVLEYATVRPNKWQNYALYSNVDLPGIRRETK